MWERNIAMEQLEEHGIGFAAKKKNEVEAKPVVHAHWEKDPVTGWEYCSHCKEDAPFSKYTDDAYESMFCPACGAQINEKEDV